MPRQIPMTILIATIVSIAVAAPVLGADGTILTDLQNQVKTATSGWEDTVMDAAKSLFWILAGIEMGIAAVWLAIQAPSLDTWFAELVRRIIFIGFFAFVLTEGPDFAKDVVDSLFQIGAGGGSASPANIFNAGVAVATQLSQNAKFGLWENNGLAFASVLAMVVVVIAFSLVAAIFLAIMVEMYVGLLAGMIMLGLGGSSFTKDFAVRYLVYAFSVGMKLMSLVMIAKIGSDVLISLAQSASPDDQYVATLTIAGVSVVVFMIAMYVPQIIQGVVQGVSVSSGMEAIRGGMQLASFGAASAGTAIGGSQLAAGAKAVYDQARNEGAGAGSAAGKAAMAFGGALASGAADKMTGAPGSYGASTLGLANQKIRENSSSKPGISSGKKAS